VTALNRMRVIPLDELAATPRAIEDGRLWLLLTSAAIADRPAIPSIAGLVVVGLAALAMSGQRVFWTAAILGHVLSTVVVYAALDLASYSVATPDFGTSAMIAAWIGVIAYRVRRRGRGVAAPALCVAAALVGWLLRPDLDVLDTEHLVALALGTATAAALPRLPRLSIPQLAPHRLASRFTRAG
jgi:hypothetical protein